MGLFLSLISCVFATAKDLISKDGAAGLIIAGITGGENDAQKYAQALADTVTADVLPKHQGVTVLAGGSAMVYSQINYQTQRDPSLLSQALSGTINQSWGQQDPRNPPPRVRALLAPYLGDGAVEDADVREAGVAGGRARRSSAAGLLARHTRPRLG